MNVDILLKGGLVVDPANGIYEKKDIAIKAGKIVSTTNSTKAEQEFDADGFLVTPGLIDFHTHAFKPGGDLGVKADTAFIPQGVTTVVDAGSSGAVTYDNFYTTSVVGNQTRIYSLINVSRLGMLTLRKHADLDPANFDVEEMQEVCSRYKGQILGVKCQQSKAIVEGLGLTVLEKTVEAAEQLGLPVIVHVTDPPEAMDKLASILRKGDVLCHCFSGTGHSILGSDGKILPGIWKARERGVIFDCASGRAHLSFAVAKAALSEGFLPDIISSDMSALTLYRYPPIGLPFVFSMLINLGMELKDVIDRCTVAPAKWMGKADQHGTLSEGAIADVTVLKFLTNRPTKFVDAGMNTLVGNNLLVPQLTVFGGKVAYRNVEFNTEA